MADVKQSIRIVSRPGFPEGLPPLDPSCHLGVMWARTLIRNLGWRPVAEFGVGTLLVESRHPRAGGDFQVIKALSVTAVVNQDSRVSMEFSLEDAHD